VWVIDPPGAARGTVFVLHGIRDRKASFVGWGRTLAANGLRAVLVDSRGHGESSGDALSYGVLEARDLSLVLDVLGAAGPVGAMGVSYGAATAIEWAGREPRVRAVVAVAPFASLHEVVPAYVNRMLPVAHHLLPAALIRRAIRRGGEIGSFDPTEASPRNAITRTRAPVLLLHGRRDIHIPPAHSESLHAAAPDHSTLRLLDGEDHISIISDRDGTVMRAALDFFAAHL
jgi:pimeloyl-ACP methyl ester carboxylesterase